MLRRINLSLLIAAAMLIAFTVSSYAQSTAINNGITWISANQNSDGSWGGTPTSLNAVYPSTTEALNAMYLMGSNSAAYSLGFQWLGNQDISYTEFIARNIIAKSHNGIDASDAVASLLSYRNQSGGWGDEIKLANDLLDSALALQALKTANYSDATVLGQSLNYLTSNQNTDGGWGLSSGDSSKAYTTALVLTTLSQFKSTYNLQASITKGITYLRSKQNSDGGFGSSPSNGYETSLAFEALIMSGADVFTQATHAVEYLTATQAADGSWNQDPYSTALALRALANIKPNLSSSQSDIVFSKTIPTVGETITVTVNVRNMGLEAANNVVVNFYDRDPATGSLPISTQTVATVSAGTFSQVSIPYTIQNTGAGRIYVILDPTNLISEVNESDNTASNRYWGATSPDLAVFSEDLSPSTYVPASGTAFTLEYKIRNLGESEAESFTVSLYDGDPSSPNPQSGSGQAGVLLQTVNISGIAGGEVRTGTIGVTLSGDGAHTLYLVADSDGQINELSEMNNAGTVTVQVGGVQKSADLVAGNITLNPSRPQAGESVQITAHVLNQGMESAQNFTVEIFAGSPEAGGSLIHTETISLAEGAEQIITTNWTVTEGIHNIYIIVDRSNEINETNETNNRISVKVMPDMIDISISATDLVLTPSRPVDGDSVVLSVTAHNLGIRDTGAFNLALYDDDPDAGGTLLQTYAVSNVPGDGSVNVTYSFTGQVKIYRFYAVADTENTVAELYEDNNHAIRAITIKGPGETYGADLVPIKIDLSGTTTDPQTLEISGNAKVTFQNKGDDKITSSFSVMVFEDMDLNGQYTPGFDTILGTGTNTTSLWPEGAGMVSVPVSGTVKFLNSPLYALIDSEDTILEQTETNNLLISCADCEKRPANPIEPVMKWKWYGGSIYPSSSVAVAHLTDDNGDGKMDERDVSSIVFSYSGSTAGIVALRGDNGQTIFQRPDSIHPVRGSLPAVGDIDGDGFPEIVIPRYSLTSFEGLVAYEHDGTLKWDNWQLVDDFQTSIGSYGANMKDDIAGAKPTIADIDGDGIAEIITGAAVFNPDGSVRWWANDRRYKSGAGIYNGSASSIVADLDLDGKPEIVAGNAAYNNDGTTKWWNKSLIDGVNAIGNFDDDPYPEIVLLWYHSWYTNRPRLYLLEHDGTVKWGPVLIRADKPWEYMQTIGSIPVVADIDGDGEPEIIVEGFEEFYIYDKNGNIKNTIIMPWVGQNQSGSNPSPAVFDLNGDGRQEIMTHDRDHFAILDAQTGAVLYDNPFGYGGTLYRSVTPVDVDGDGQVEIVATNNADAWYRNNGTVRVYEAKNNDWVGARSVWNQYSYHVTNTSDNSTIPQYESPSWLMNNTYRTQARVGESPNPYLAPNLTASSMRMTQNGPAVDLTVRVGNGGAKEASAGAVVTFYNGDPATGGTVIGTASTTRSLNPGEYQDIIYNWTGGSIGLHHIYAVVDSANAVSECREDDNQANADLTIQFEYADLTIKPEDITLPAGPYYEGIPVAITGNVRNIGGLSASNIIARLFSGNPATGGTQIGADQVLPAINAGSSALITFTFDTLAKTGTNVLYIVIDPDNVIAEVSKTNNTAPVMVSVEQPVLPDLSISIDDIQLSPATPAEGQNLSVSATIHNLGAAAGNVPVRIYLGDPVSGGSLLSEQTIYPTMAFNTTASIQASIDTTGIAGQQQIYVLIDPANTISESRETNNKASQQVFIQAAGLATSVSLDKADYHADETATVTVTAGDTTGYSRSLTLALLVKDSAGNTIATISQSDPITAGPNSITPITRTWNAGAALTGQYSLIAEFSESGWVVSRKITNFMIAPDTRVNASVTTDKISYNPNDTAALTSTVTSQSRNYVFENLTAKMTVAGGIGQGVEEESALYVETRAISSLMPGASYNFKSYWNTGTYPAGTYPVMLEVKDSTGTIIATSTVNVNLLSSSRTGAGISGTLTAGSSHVYQGREETLTYGILNNGNEDVSGLIAKAIIVDPETGEVKSEFSKQYALSRGTSIEDAHIASTSNLAPRTYLAVLQVQTADMAEPKTLASAYFEVKPGIEITKTIPDIKNVLVWMNDSNAECRGHGAEGMEQGENHGNAVASVQKCARLDLIEQALTDAGVKYTIVLDKKDFQAELRNPLYTDIMILGDQNPIEDHISEELREQVFAGKGLISSLFNRQNLDSEVFGITFRGILPSECGMSAECGVESRLVEITGNQLGIQGSFQAYGKAVKVKAVNPDDAVAWIIEDTVKGPVLHPAIISRSYGKGKALFLAFDLAMSSRAPIPFTALLKESLNFIHTPLDPASLKPNQMVPIEITLKSLGAAFDVRITETYPESVRIAECTLHSREPLVDAGINGVRKGEFTGDSDACAWVAENPWVRTTKLAAGETKKILYYARTPDKAGTYAFQTEAGYLDDGNYIPYQTIESQITVAKSTEEILSETLSGLQSLNLKSAEASARNNAVRHIINGLIII